MTRGGEGGWVVSWWSGDCDRDVTFKALRHVKRDAPQFGLNAASTFTVKIRGASLATSEPPP